MTDPPPRRPRINKYTVIDCVFLLLLVLIIGAVALHYLGIWDGPHLARCE